MTNKEIANEIWSQMKALDGNLVMCMGVTDLTVVERGLQFKVNGLSFKGNVAIKLNGRDLYDISFLKQKRTQNQAAKEHGLKRFDVEMVVVKTLNDIYGEDMMDLLDFHVEKGQVD